MKILFTVIFCFVSLCVYSQKADEKEIFSLSPGEDIEIYNVKYNPQHNVYLYSPYDSIAKTSKVISNKGNSNSYSFINLYNTFFDYAGNYYLAAYNNITDTTFKYFLLKNGQEIVSYDFINDNWEEKNGKLYFQASDKGKSFVAAYNQADGTIEKGKAYDEIFLIKYKNMPEEGEPIGYIGFTEDGKPYYLASENNSKFIVVGNEEMKHYSDIDAFNVVLDKRGEFTFFAKDKGTFYSEKGNTFLVQGTKEYPKYDFLYGPVLFNESNMPLYISVDSGAVFSQRVMTGDKEGKTYDGIWDLKFTPAGKVSYIASVQKDAENSESFTVIDGKEGKHYSAVNSLIFGPDTKPIMIVSKKNNKYFVVTEAGAEKDSYDNILEAKKLPDGTLAYIGINNGNYEKKIPDKYYVNIGGNKSGPYENSQQIDYKSYGYIIGDKDGNYAFATGKAWEEGVYNNMTLHYNDKVSSNFDYFDNVMLFNGKILYTASRREEENVYKYGLYYDNNLISPQYDGIMDFTFDPLTGTASFAGDRDDKIYWVTVKL